MFGKLLDYRLQRWVLLIACCLAVFGGVAFARQQQLDDARWLWLIVPAVVFSLRKQNLVTLLLLTVLFFGIGWWRGTEYVHKLAVHTSLQHHRVVMVGRAAEDAVYGKRYQLEFSIDNVQVVSPKRTALVGSVAVGGFGEPAVNRGDVVEVVGSLYPTRGNNLGSINFAELKILRHDRSLVNEFRRRFAAGMQSALPEPVASFGLGLLIGQRNTLPQDTSDQLRRVGLTHIIAVSGYNLTIIVMACRRLLAKRSKFQATFACMALIGLFLLITGSSPPIVRAAVISVLSIGAWYYGRAIKPLVLLLLSAAITVLANPIYLWGNVSWYLSFLAFFGVLVLAPLVTRRLLGGKEPPVLTGIFIESACASLVVTPYILFVFGQASLVGLPANLLVIPFVPLAMVLSVAAGTGGMLAPALAGWIAWPAKWLMTYMLDAANLLSRIPRSFVEHVGFSAASMAVSYAALGFVCLTLWSKTRKTAIITEKIKVK